MHVPMRALQAFSPILCAAATRCALLLWLSKKVSSWVVTTGARKSCHALLKATSISRTSCHLERSPTKRRLLSKISAWPVAVYVQHMAKGTVGVYMQVDVPSWQGFTAEKEVAWFAGFEFLVKFGGITFTRRPPGVLLIYTIDHGRRSFSLRVLNSPTASCLLK